MKPLTLPVGMALLMLTGCCTLKAAAPDDPEVAARCPPVRDLLSKNYHRDGKVDLAIINIGGIHDRTGAILSGAEGERVAIMDGLCRAWVRKDLSGKDYAQTLLQMASATIVQTSSPEDRDAVTASMIEELKRLKTEGWIPPEFDPGALASRVKTDSLLTQAQLDASLQMALAGLTAAATHHINLATLQQAALLSRLDSVDNRLVQIEKRGGAIPNPPPPPDVPASLEVFFSTGSSEVTYDGRRRLREAGKAWAVAGSKVTVLGYSDPRGDPRRNAALSGARAKAVASLLKKLGVAVLYVRGAGVGSGADEDDGLRVVRIRID